MGDTVNRICTPMRRQQRHCTPLLDQSTLLLAAQAARRPGHRSIPTAARLATAPRRAAQSTTHLHGGWHRLVTGTGPVGEKRAQGGQSAVASRVGTTAQIMAKGNPGMLRSAMPCEHSSHQIIHCLAGQFTCVICRIAVAARQVQASHGWKVGCVARSTGVWGRWSVDDLDPNTVAAHASMAKGRTGTRFQVAAARSQRCCRAWRPCLPTEGMLYQTLTHPRCRCSPSLG